MSTSRFTILHARAALRRAALAIVAAMLLASCGSSASGQRAVAYLDDTTGATITRVTEPLILFSDDPARAANARDYIYAAPVAVNQAGRHSWWLWLGLWSTIDRGVSAGPEQQPDIARIHLIVDGEPMELDMDTRVADIPGLSRVPYAMPMGTANIILPLTGSQVTRLGRGAGISIYTEATGGEARLWQPWIESDAGTSFADLAAADPGLLVR